MDTPTHALIGRLVARQVWKEKEDRATVNLVTVMGLLPDIDTLFGGDDLTYIQEHRGITHSVFGIAAIGLVVALIAGRLGVRGSFRERYAISCAGMLLHVLFDVFTSYGTQVLAPFSDHRFTIDVFFIIDPYLTGILILTLLGGWLWRTKVYRFGFAVFIGYLGLNVALLGYGYRQAQVWADDYGVDADRIGVMPMPFSPLHRRAFVESGDQTFWITVPAFGRTGASLDSYARATRQPELDFVWRTEAGETYRWFARFPVIRKREGATVIVEDLTYKVKASGLGWLGDAALESLLNRTPEFLDRKLFYLEIDLETQDVVFRR